jgi:hydrogenase maturation protein HypF
VALSLCWEGGFPLAEHWQELGQKEGKANGIKPEDIALLKIAWQRKINCPQTSAVGRLFDAASSLLGLVDVATYEAQGPVMLEELASSTPHCKFASKPIMHLPQHKDGNGVLRCDWAPLIEHLLDRQYPVAERAANFHTVLADTLVTQAVEVRDCAGVNCVGLTGGVFQNRLLMELTVELLEQQGFEVIVPEKIPANDAGISYGQIIEILGRENLTRSHEQTHRGKQ